ncbi:hypothetical protein FZEAL_7210 [Fusarium zealandicum]|uniref:Uncharacterized protein n=1 Tax=Fusarium zealandicum TaxID=1053134 RepID=A0A8H4UGT8_9HYPO|nr:hypothetical protein FZEAL_7210 [Fusarium zealandicum]
MSSKHKKSSHSRRNIGFLEALALYVAPEDVRRQALRRARHAPAKSASRRARGPEPGRRNSEAPPPPSRWIGPEDALPNFDDDDDGNDDDGGNDDDDDECCCSQRSYDGDEEQGEVLPNPPPQVRGVSQYTETPSTNTPHLRSRWSQSAAPEPSFMGRMMNRMTLGDDDPAAPEPRANPRHRMSYDPAADPLLAQIPRRGGDHLPGEIVVHRQRPGEHGVRVRVYGRENGEGPSRAPSQAQSRPPSQAQSQGQSRPPSQAQSRAASQAASRAQSRPLTQAQSQAQSRPPSQGQSRPPSQGQSRAPPQGTSRLPSQAQSRAPSQAPSRTFLQPRNAPQPPRSQAQSFAPRPRSHSATEPGPFPSGPPPPRSFVSGDTHNRISQWRSGIGAIPEDDDDMARSEVASTVWPGPRDGTSTVMPSDSITEVDWRCDDQSSRPSTRGDSRRSRYEGSESRRRYE